MSESHVSRRGKSVAFAALALATAAAAVVPDAPARSQAPTLQEARTAGTDKAQDRKPEPQKDRRTQQTVAPGFRRGTAGYGRRSRPGWTQNHVKRMARKERNRSRNRKAHRA